MKDIINILPAFFAGSNYYQNVMDGPDAIRTHDLPVISRAHHRAMLRAQKDCLKFTLLVISSEFL